MIPDRLHQRIRASLAGRREKQLLRNLPDPAHSGFLNLADNDYLELSKDPALIASAQNAAATFGCSSSASPLISGYGIPHHQLEQKLCKWHRFPSGLIWNSGFIANQELLTHLPKPGDIIFADRLIHNSMISGILRSGARLIRFRHNDIDHLHQLLQTEIPPNGVRFVLTESVFSMDGDIPDLSKIIALKSEFPFFLILDEAHATGWYGPSGAGLSEELSLESGIDILVGTLGKSLGSQGAYTLFQNPDLRDFLINNAGGFIYSTHLNPISAAVASSAIKRIQSFIPQQNIWRQTSRDFRNLLQNHGWEVPAGDSPIVPILIGENEKLLSLSSFLREHKILCGAIRPPTVPSGSSRIRFSLKKSFTPETAERIASLLNQWRDSQK